MSKVYVKVPEQILNDLRLKSNDVRVYVQMRKRYVLFTSQGRPYLDSVEQIGEAIGLNRNAMFKSLNTLEKCGYITRKKIDGRKNKYDLHDCLITEDVQSIGKNK